MESNKLKPRVNSGGLRSNDPWVAGSGLAIKERITFCEQIELTIAYCIHKIRQCLTNSLGQFKQGNLFFTLVLLQGFRSDS